MGNQIKADYGYLSVLPVKGKIKKEVISFVIKI
jgi:hypothetical protein